MNSLIPGLKSGFDTINFGVQFARTMQAGAAPAFELQFFKTQDAVLGRLDEEIAELQKEKNTSGATAFLEIQINKLQLTSGALSDYHARTKSNNITGQGVVKAIPDLQALTAPATSAEFDTALASLISEIDKLDTPLFERFGVPDGLRKVKEQALADLGAIVTNGFATQGDIDAVQSTLTGVSAAFSSALTITQINQEMAFDLSTSTNERISDLKGDISSIQLGAQADQIEEIKATRERFSAILTALSLSFEVSQSLTAFINDNTIFPNEPPPGSVLNLFS